jgi:hypothetical protein
MSIWRFQTQVVILDWPFLGLGCSSFSEVSDFMLPHCGHCGLRPQGKSLKHHLSDIF